MATKYLLPCACGKSVPVDASQAGLLVRCACGAAMEAPTGQRLRQLPVAPGVASPAPAANWGAGQRLLFLGAVLEAVGMAAAIYLWATFAPRPTFDVNVAAIRQDMDRLEMADLFKLSAELTAGLDPAMPEHPVLAAYERYARRQTVMIIASIVGAAVGTTLLASGILVLRSRPTTARNARR
jgi:hypothetical protein